MTTTTHIPLPEELAPVIEALPKAYLVGGCVRDHLLGRIPKDLDIEVYDITYEELVAKLRPFGRADLVGQSFGVVKLMIPHGGTYDFTLPRRDSKIGPGHTGFAVEVDISLTPKEAASRRDLTINSVAYDPKRGQIHDFFNGLDDLRNKILRHTSPQFGEDPLRVLRIMQFAARFGFDTAPETIDLCRSIKDEFHTLARERVREEFVKMLTKGADIKRGLEFLNACGWLGHFPELGILDGCPQDVEWHPEGDVFVHTGYCCNALASLAAWKSLPEQERLIAMLGILCHDLGKPSCTSEVWKEKLGRNVIASPGHDLAGVEPTNTLLQRLGFSESIAQKVVPLVACHMAHLRVRSDAEIRHLAVDVHPNNMEGLALIIEADHSGRPPLEACLPKEMRSILDRARAMNCATRPPDPILKGRHLIERGMDPGKAVGVLCDNAYDAQLDGSIKDLEDAGAWIRKHRSQILEMSRLGPQRLLDGKELQGLGIPSGPLLGQIHREIYERQLDGKIRTREEAIQLAKDCLQAFGKSPRPPSG